MKTQRLSKSLEDYLEMIYMLRLERGEVRVKHMATRLNVSLPSVTEMIRKLAKRDLVKYERYGIIELTVKGRSMAKDVYKKHKLLTRFFLSIGIDKRTAMHDACLAEHVLSRKTISKINEFVRSS
jgi:DtxR family Mn-dependent transcriptional regulator